MMNKFRNGMGRVASTLAFSLLVIPCVHAGEPALNAQQLAITERVLKFCGPVNPDAAKKLQEKVSELVKGRSEADLATARDSEEYKKGYAMIDGIVAQTDERNANALCTNSAADK